MIPSERAIAHWAEAAFYFSLDSSEDVLNFLVPDFRLWGDLRLILREAINRNRELAANGGKALFFKDTVETGIIAAASRTALVSFVEERLVSYAVGAPHKYSPLISVFERMDINERCSQISHKILGIPDLRIHIVSQVDHDCYKDFANIVSEIDVKIDSRSISNWDLEIIGRNSEIYSDTDPISNLILTFDLQHKNDSINFFRRKIGEEKYHKIISSIIQDNGIN
jgi:hypothetical protein